MTDPTTMTVLVTGGSSGLGAAVVDAVVKAGGRPFVIDRQPPAEGVPWVECDLADTRAAEAATREVIAQAAGSAGDDDCVGHFGASVRPRAASMVRVVDRPSRYGTITHWPPQRRSSSASGGSV